MGKHDSQGSFRGFGFVTFESEETAKSVVENCSNIYHEGKWIDCKASTDTPQASSTSKGKGGVEGDKDNLALVPFTLAQPLVDTASLTMPGAAHIAGTASL